MNFYFKSGSEWASLSFPPQRAVTNKSSQGKKQQTYEAIVVSQFDLESQAGNQKEEQIQKVVLILLHTSSAPWGPVLESHWEGTSHHQGVQRNNCWSRWLAWLGDNWRKQQKGPPIWVHLGWKIWGHQSSSYWALWKAGEERKLHQGSQESWRSETHMSSSQGSTDWVLTGEKLGEDLVFMILTYLPPTPQLVQPWAIGTSQPSRLGSNPLSSLGVFRLFQDS